MFLNPIMLAGLAGAMLPVVLHLMSRARYRNVQWGAMMFLGADDPRQSRWERVKEWSLLLMRMVTVGLLAVAMARPVIAPSGALVDGPMSTVIVLDRSGSMGIAQNGPARLESAIRAAAEVASNLDPQDEVALIATPPIPGGTIGPTTDIRRVVLRLGDINSSGNRADLAAAIDEAHDLLGRSHAAFKHLVVITDRQAASWRGVDERLAAQWKSRVAGAGGPPVAFSVIPIAGQEVGNVAVESVEVANPPVIRGLPAEIEVRVRNYDTIPSEAIPLTILMGPQELHRATVNLDAGGRATIRCAVSFPEAGSYFVTARLGPSGLSIDDAMDAAIEVTEPISVLVISGDQRDRPASELRSEADFISLAIAPYEFSDRPGPDLARVDVVTSDAWPELKRTQHQVVILANVPRLVEAQVRQLEQFVYGGGGLIIAPGNLARVDEYNDLLWRDGAGLLPAPLVAPTPADGSGATTLLGLDLSHSIFQFLKGRDEPVPQVIVDRYFPTDSPAAMARVLGQYASGQPFLIEAEYGRGRIMLFTTPLDADWSRLPQSNIYLPMLQSAVRYLLSGVLPDRNGWVNDPIVAMIDDPVEPLAWIDAPVGRPASIDLLRVGDAYEARYINTARPGQYTLRVKTLRGDREIRFAVRAPRDESDVTNLTAGEMADRQKLLGFELVDPDAGSIGEAVAGARRRLELWPWLLGCVVVLAVAEVALARAWSAQTQEVIA